jgi:hypothetical protein
VQKHASPPAEGPQLLESQQEMVCKQFEHLQSTHDSAVLCWAAGKLVLGQTDFIMHVTHAVPAATQFPLSEVSFNPPTCFSGDYDACC